jgi:hypothetical protein
MGVVLYISSTSLVARASVFSTTSMCHSTHALTMLFLSWRYKHSGLVLPIYYTFILYNNKGNT